MTNDFDSVPFPNIQSVAKNNFKADVEVKIDKEGKKLHIIDQGLGMTAEEVEKYINQIGFEM